MSWSKQVFSTMVQEIAYDEETSEMVVTWKNGKISVYSGVPEDVAEQVANAPSVGQAMNQMVKTTYSHRYI